MANEKNLKKGKGFDTRTTEEQREIARKGGIASGEARREKRLIKDRILERMGESDWDAMIDGLIERAIESDKAFEILRDTIGQKPIDRIQMTEIDQDIIDEVESMVNADKEDSVMKDDDEDRGSRVPTK